MTQAEAESQRNKGLALSGAVIVGAIVPTILLGVNVGTQRIGEFAEARSSFRDGCIQLLCASLSTCAPGALALGSFLFRMCEDVAKQRCNTRRSFLLYGTLFGAVLDVFNIPLLILAVNVFRSPEWIWIQLILLFAATGASIGFWVAWQVWRAWQSEEKLFPRFSLGMLLIVVLAWGALLAVFAPK